MEPHTKPIRLALLLARALNVLALVFFGLLALTDFHSGLVALLAQRYQGAAFWLVLLVCHLYLLDEVWRRAPRPD